MRINAASDAGDELIRQSASLLMSNQTRPLMSGKLARRVGMMSSIHLPFVSASFGGRHLSNQDRLFLRRQERVDILEYLLEGLPAAVLCTPVVAIDPGPINIGIAGIVVHRRPVATGGIGDVRTPRPDHVGRARGNEEIVNVPISGNVQGCVIAAPRLIAVHFGGKIQEEFLAECFGSIRTRLDRRIEAAVDDLGKVDVVGFPIDQRDASGGQVRLGNAAVPVGGPRVVRQMNGRCPPSFAAV